MVEISGGPTAENIARIALLIREIKPDFSPQYLQTLLRGQPPTNDDRYAISQVLEPEAERWVTRIWRLEDLEPRRLAKYAYLGTRNREQSIEFVDFVLSEARFRDGELPDHEIGTLFREFSSNQALEDEIELFGLKV